MARRQRNGDHRPGVPGVDNPVVGDPAGSLALYATGRVADDGIIDPRDTRTVIAMALSACHSAPVQGASGYGVFRL